MWKLDISAKYHFVSIVNSGSGDPRINFGSIRVDKDKKPLNEPDKKRVAFAQKVCNALNAYQDS